MPFSLNRIGQIADILLREAQTRLIDVRADVAYWNLKNLLLQFLRFVGRLNNRADGGGTARRKKRIKPPCPMLVFSRT